MNLYLLSASFLSIILGIIHSVMGEYLIFSKLRRPTLSDGSGPIPILGARQIGILWATWHLASLLAWSLAAILYFLSNGQMVTDSAMTYKITMVPAFLFSALLVFYGTKGKHPGWVVLAAISFLTSLG